MTLNILITLTILLSIIVVIESKEQNKPGKLYKLCGVNFVQAWHGCCEMGYPACAKKTASSGVKVLERRGSPLIPSNIAKNFFGHLKKRGWGEEENNLLKSVAVEECCIETCSYKEVSEYPCFA